MTALPIVKQLDVVEQGRAGGDSLRSSSVKRYDSLLTLTVHDETNLAQEAIPIRLSEAIMLGSMLRPQKRDAFMTPTGSCALGAAAEALGFLANGDLTPYAEQWPWVARPVECPVCRAGLSVVDVIMDLIHQGGRS